MPGVTVDVPQIICHQVAGCSAGYKHLPFNAPNLNYRYLETVKPVVLLNSVTEPSALPHQIFLAQETRQKAPDQM